MEQMIFSSFRSESPPPLAKAVKNFLAGRYSFSPLSRSKFIYSGDPALWKDGATIELFLPTPEETQAFMKKIGGIDGFFVFILCDFKEIKLLNFKKNLTPALWKEDWKIIYNFTDIGYDILDPFTGVSLLNNVGYNSSEFKKIISSNIRSNQYGLLDSKLDAEKFINVTAGFVPEHEPAIVANVLMKKPIGFFEDHYTCTQAPGNGS